MLLARDAARGSFQQRQLQIFLPPPLLYALLQHAHALYYFGSRKRVRVLAVACGRASDYAQIDARYGLNVLPVAVRLEQRLVVQHKRAATL